MKQTTIHLLATVVTMALGLSTTRAEKTHVFSSAADCGVCHEAAYKEWQQSFHSQASRDSIFWLFYQRAVSEMEDQAEGHCLGCHAPIAIMQNEIKATDRVDAAPALSALAREGVTCDFCHSIAGNKHTAKGVDVGAYRYPGFLDSSHGVKYGRHADAVTDHHPTEASEFLIQSEFCGICHKTVHRVGGRQLQNTYQEWRLSPYRKEGVRCQDCHMPRYRGQLAVDGPVRDEVHAHVFRGGQLEMLKTAVDLELNATIIRRKDRLDLQVNASVENIGAGHYVPTGMPGLRELWLAVEGYTAAGEKVLDERVDYSLELFDANGELALFWNTAKIGKDTRLRPRRAQESKWRVRWPDGGAESIELRATIYYRKISTPLAEKIGMPAPEAIPVVSDHVRVYPTGHTEGVSDNEQRFTRQRDRAADNIGLDLVNAPKPLQHVVE